MQKPLVFMFSGQGSQYYQMGHELFLNNSTFRHWLEQADLIVQKTTSHSFIEEIYSEKNRKSDPMTQLSISHPAIFALEHATAQMLMQDYHVEPQYVLGTSLGEIAAAAIAGYITFEDALSSVITQAKLLSENCVPAGLLAILAPVNLYHESTELRQNTELAAVNFDQHFIVAGRDEILKNIAVELTNKNITSQLLPVSYAFHSSLIEVAAEPYCTTLPVFNKENRFPLISCCYAQELQQLPPDLFWQAVRQPILFQKTIQMLEQRNSYFYLDLGPSGTLATFIKYNLQAGSASQGQALLTPYGTDLKNLNKTIELLKS